jgi:hypothetical protein
VKVGDLVQEKLIMWSGDRLGRVGIIMEATQIQMPEGDPDIMGMVLWTGNTDWEIIYPEDVIIISEAVQ